MPAVKRCAYTPSATPGKGCSVSPFHHFPVSPILRFFLSLPTSSRSARQWYDLFLFWPRLGFTVDIFVQSSRIRDWRFIGKLDRRGNFLLGLVIDRFQLRFVRHS